MSYFRMNKNYMGIAKIAICFSLQNFCSLKFIYTSAYTVYYRALQHPVCPYTGAHIIQNNRLLRKQQQQKPVYKTGNGKWLPNCIRNPFLYNFRSRFPYL